MAAISVADCKNVSPTYEVGINKSIFIWLDILGWSDELEEDSKYKALADLLRKFQALFNESDGYSTTIISDGIVLQIRMRDGNSGYNRFIKTLKDIGEKQFRFICENKYFIRGGMSIGTKLEAAGPLEDMDGRQFISNGLARAVKIETNHVSWPVIGTTKDVLPKIREIFQINNQDEDFGLAKGFNIHGADLYFIDFLQKNEGYYNLLNVKIKEFKDKPAIQNKYVWLLRYYHNRFGIDKLDEALTGVVL